MANSPLCPATKIARALPPEPLFSGPFGPCNSPHSSGEWKAVPSRVPPSVLGIERESCRYSWRFTIAIAPLLPVMTDQSASMKMANRCRRESACPNSIVAGNTFWRYWAGTMSAPGFPQCSPRMIGDFPQTTIEEMAEILHVFGKNVFESRTPTPARDLRFDTVEAAVIGFSPRMSRIRCFATTAQDKFCVQETTEDPNARVFAFGNYDMKTDAAPLEALTSKMQVAHTKKVPWVAAQLRETVNDFHDKYPREVGPASYFWRSIATDSRNCLLIFQRCPRKCRRLLPPRIWSRRRRKTRLTVAEGSSSARSSRPWPAVQTR